MGPESFHFDRFSWLRYIPFNYKIWYPGTKNIKKKLILQSQKNYREFSIKFCHYLEITALQKYIWRIFRVTNVILNRQFEDMVRNFYFFTIKKYKQKSKQQYIYKLITKFKRHKVMKQFCKKKKKCSSNEQTNKRH